MSKFTVVVLWIVGISTAIHIILELMIKFGDLYTKLLAVMLRMLNPMTWVFLPFEHLLDFSKRKLGNHYRKQFPGHRVGCMYYADSTSNWFQRWAMGLNGYSYWKHPSEYAK